MAPATDGGGGEIGLPTIHMHFATIRISTCMKTPATSSDDQHLTFDEARVVLASLHGDAYQCGIDLMLILMALDVVSREIRAHPEVPNSELLRLLTWSGVIAEWGARALYNRTGRGDVPFIVDKLDWERYLAETSHAAPGPV